MSQGHFIFTEEPPYLYGSWQIICGNTLNVLRDLDSPCISLWITSPPYYHQIDYGDPNQYGHEASVEEYITIQGLVAKEMLRLSTEDAVLFWIVRDSFNGSGGAGGDYRKDGQYRMKLRGARDRDWPRKAQLLVPERTRIAFAAIGWVPVLKLIWDKQSSLRGARDRPSYSYEEILMFSKSSEHCWNREAVLQEYASSTLAEIGSDYKGKGDHEHYRARNQENPSDTKRRIIASMEARPGAYLRSVLRLAPGKQPSIPVNGDIVTGIASFPLLLAEMLVLLASNPNDWVGDPYMGMGTTLVAAVKWGRHALGIELSERFCDAAHNRLKSEINFTDKKVRVK